MKRLLSPFLLTLSAIVAVGYAYLAWRLTASAAARWALLLPCLLIWLVPAIYWVGGRESTRRADELLHAASYLCMGGLNFLLLFTLARDLLLGLARLAQAPGLYAAAQGPGVAVVFGGALAALGIGALVALRGPRLRPVSIPIDGLAPGLEGLRIVQISDLHVGPTIGERYVRRVVERSNALQPDLVVLTGDIVDGSPARLARHVAPLGALRAVHGSVFIRFLRETSPLMACLYPHLSECDVA